MENRMMPTLDRKREAERLPYGFIRIPLLREYDSSPAAPALNDSVLICVVGANRDSFLCYNLYKTKKTAVAVF